MRICLQNTQADAETKAQELTVTKQQARLERAHRPSHTASLERVQLESRSEQQATSFFQASLQRKLKPLPTPADSLRCLQVGELASRLEVASVSKARALEEQEIAAAERDTLAAEKVGRSACIMATGSSRCPRFAEEFSSSQVKLEEELAQVKMLVEQLVQASQEGSCISSPPGLAGNKTPKFFSATSSPQQNGQGQVGGLVSADDQHTTVIGPQILFGSQEVANGLDSCRASHSSVKDYEVSDRWSSYGVISSL